MSGIRTISTPKDALSFFGKETIQWIYRRFLDAKAGGRLIWGVLFVILTGCGMSAGNHENYAGDFSFSEYKSEVTITGISSSGFNKSFLEIPSTIDGKIVTAIGESAFYGKTNLISITIPYGIEFIGDYAFSGTEITEIVLPGSIKTIGKDIFWKAPLVHVTFGEGITSIQDYMFHEKATLTSVTLPDTLVSIGTDAFSSTGLTSITIPLGVTTIGRQAFFNTDLTEVVIPDSVVSLEGGAFANTELDSVVIGKRLVTLGDHAFFDTNLKQVTLPENVSYIGEDAFKDVPLASVRILSPMAPETAEGSFPVEDEEGDGLVLYYPDGSMGYEDNPWIEFSAMVAQK